MLLHFFKKKVPLTIIILLALLYLINWSLPIKITNLDASWFKDTNGAPLVIAHQGGNQERPSSTNLAFEHAVDIGAKILEFDLALTKDNRLITIHDLTLDRTTNGTGRVRDKTYEEIRKLNAAYGLEDESGKPIRDKNRNPYIDSGAYIPTLEEVFTKYGDKRMLIELKDHGEDGKKSARILWNLVKQYHMENKVVIASFDEDTLNELRRISDNKIITSASTTDMYYFYAFHQLRLPALNNRSSFEELHLPLGYNLAGIHINLLTERLLNDAHSRNMPVYYWTINDVQQMRELINMGVDGIITDRPELLIKLLKEENIQ